MKRLLSGDDNINTKKAKLDEETEALHARGRRVYFDDNVLFEVLKHVDARSLAVASCVSKQWHDAARDERLWELICTKQWVDAGCGLEQLRSVVHALGGFRRLHALCLWPIFKLHTSSSSSSSSPSSRCAGPQVIRANHRLGKDEVFLSLSLLSIRYYEKMNFNSRKNR